MRIADVELGRLAPGEIRALMRTEIIMLNAPRVFRIADQSPRAAETLFANVVQSGKQQAAEAAFQLGELAYDRIDYATAYQYYLEAARLQPENAAYVNTAGRITQEMGRYQEALPFLVKALDIREKSLGPNHPDVAQSLNNLAVLYDAQGQHAKAEPLYQRSLKIWEKSLGPDHPDVAKSLNNLATLYYAQGQHAKAEPLYQRSLRIWEKSLGLDHPDVAMSLENYAELLAKTGRTKEASQLAARAQAIRGKHQQSSVGGNAKNPPQTNFQR